jgi:transcriptional regulator with XRE-family HTH domain
MMRLGSVLRKYRTMREITVRDLAKEMGISFPTLSRIEHGLPMDATTLMKILNWLMARDEEQ